MNIPQNYDEARAAADAARDRANRIKTRIQRNIEDAILNDTPNGRHYRTQHIDDIVRKQCREDPLWASAVKVNQWMIEYATMYAQGELLEKMNAILAQLRTANGDRVVAS